MTGTGLKKCIPMTCDDLLVAAAIRVIEIDEVFDARIALPWQSNRADRKSSFSSRFSVAASTIRSQSERLASSVEVVMRASTAVFSASDLS